MRANARLKYLVHTLGVDKFRKLAESYMGFKVFPQPLTPSSHKSSFLFKFRKLAESYMGFKVCTRKLKTSTLVALGLLMEPKVTTVYMLSPNPSHR